MNRWKLWSWCAVSLVLACSENDDAPADAASDGGRGGREAGGGALVDTAQASAADGNAGRDAGSAGDAAAADAGDPEEDSASAADVRTTGDEFTSSDASASLDSSASLDASIDPDSSTNVDGGIADDAAQAEGGLPGVTDATTRGEGSLDIGSLRDASGGGLIDPNMVPPRPPTF